MAKNKLIRIMLAGVVALVGLILAIIVSRPPHQVAVAVLKTPVPAGTAIPATALTHELVPQQWAQAAHLLTVAQATGFRSQVALPLGLPIPAADRWQTHLPAGMVAMPIITEEGDALGVVAGDRVAIMTPSTGGAAGGMLDATGVRVISVQVPAGAPNLQMTEDVVVVAPAGAAATLAGTTNPVLAVMAGHPATQWDIGPTKTSSSTGTSSSSSAKTSSKTSSSSSVTAKKTSSTTTKS